MGRARSVLAAATAAVLAAFGLAGCALTGDAGQAAALLQRAGTAAHAVSSETFIVTVRFSAKGQEGSVSIDGGAYAKGPSAGDAYFTMTADVPGAATQGVPTDIAFVARDGRAVMRALGRRVEVPLVQGGRQTSSGALASELGGFDFSKIVKDVSVGGGEEIAGEKMTKIVGVLDTAALVRQSFVQAAASGDTSVAGIDPSMLANLGDHLGDTRVVLFVSERTGLVMRALADATVKGLGSTGDVTFSMSYAVTSVDRPLVFPSI